MKGSLKHDFMYQTNRDYIMDWNANLGGIFNITYEMSKAFRAWGRHFEPHRKHLGRSVTGRSASYGNWLIEYELVFPSNFKSGLSFLP